MFILIKFIFKFMPAKRRHAVGKMKRTTSHKTKKRLAIKRKMIKSRANKKKTKK